jgi:stearoyl-CoA desaturase (delta-9 desaturase)
MLWVPILGTVLAFVEAVEHGVTVLNLELFSLFYLVNGFGITVGFHRLLAHRAFQAPRWITGLLAIAGSMAGQGPPIYWVANHRRHHHYSDQEGDPHSPYVNGTTALSGWSGFWHAHLGWTFEHALTSTLVYTPDLLRNAVLRWVNRHYLLWLVSGIVVPALIGGMVTRSWVGAYSAGLWGGLVRLFFAYQFTLAINSATHLFGAQAFDTGDHSRNTSWLALPTLGEAWHNNHHAFPTAAVFAARWWQVDLGGYLVLLLQRCGLIHGARPINQEMITRKQRKK